MTLQLKIYVVHTKKSYKNSKIYMYIFIKIEKLIIIYINLLLTYYLLSRNLCFFLVAAYFFNCKFFYQKQCILQQIENFIKKQMLFF